MQQERILLATAVYSFFLTIIQIINGFINDFSFSIAVSVLLSAGFVVLGIVKNSRAVFAWIGISFISSAIFSLSLQYFYILLLFFINIQKRKVQAIFFLYWGVALIMTAIHPSETVKLLQQLISSAGAFFLYSANVETRQICVLQLTEDEEFILDELSQGKQQKEIRRWNKNTVSKKLKQARERNNILSNAELLLVYREKMGLFLGKTDCSHILNEER